MAKKFTIVFVVILTCCLVFIVSLSGFQFENKKFKTFLITAYLVLLLVYLLADPCCFALLSLYNTLRKGNNEKSNVSPPDLHTQFTRSTYLNIRLASLRYNLLLSGQHSNEKANVRYRRIVEELCIFMSYFVLLLLLVVYTRDPLAYYNTHIVHTVLWEPLLGVTGAEEIRNIEDLYEYLESAIIGGLNEESVYIGPEWNSTAGWIRHDLAKLVGVVRMRQLRFGHDVSVGQEYATFSTQSHFPGWELPYVEYPYEYMYWRIYEPWLTYSDTSFKNLLLVATQHGAMYTYPEGEGYVALLARHHNNSMVILHYLRQYIWLDRRTAALIFDFTLLNVDSNIFSVCSVLLEQTPFGSVIPHVDVQSCELLMNLDHFGFLGVFMIMLYVMLMLKFAKVYVLTAWYVPRSLCHGWNVVDALIIFLNLLILFLLYKREATVTILLNKISESEKLQFQDFRIPAQLDYLVVVFMGLLVCIATVRIWKILQFARIFRMFTHTLNIAKWALLSTTLIIVIVLYSFSLSSCLINGANSAMFNQMVRSLTASMSLAFGFGKNFKADDLNFGGYLLGIFLYAVLMLVVAIILVNMFITLIIDYFDIAKQEQEDNEKLGELSFMEFLKAEYAWLPLKWKTCFQKSKKITVQQDMQNALDRLLTTYEEKVQQQEQQRRLVLLHAAAAELESVQVDVLKEQQERIEHLNLMSDILKTQMELLEYRLTVFDIDQETDEEETYIESERSSDNSYSKNGKLNLNALLFQLKKFCLL